jgi:hypothetical protein
MQQVGLLRSCASIFKGKETKTWALFLVLKHTRNKLPQRRAEEGTYDNCMLKNEPEAGPTTTTSPWTCSGSEHFCDVAVDLAQRFSPMLDITEVF